jgi:pSer/pThr/pTyr-binding forkhead associated (FHA) protein
MPVLIGISVDYKGKSFDLTDDEITVGRNDENYITLNNASISGSHCKLVKEGTNYILTDLGSTNGTRVNGQPITESVLQDRDVVHFGSLEFVYADRMPDNDDVESLRTQVLMPPQGQGSTASTSKSETFSSVSPFAAPKKASKGTWYVLIAVIGVLALVCVALLFYILLTS